MIITIAGTVADAVLKSFLGKRVEEIVASKQTKKAKGKLRTECEKLFHEFADTSLDCDEFYDYIKSHKLHVFLLELYGFKNIEKYSPKLMTYFTDDAKKFAPNCDKDDIK